MRILLALCALLAAGAAAAQTYPNKPIRMVVPYAAGGLPDTMSRIVALRMGESIGQQMVIENRGGAGGISGTEAVARSPADGYTLLVADVGQVAINPHLFAKLPYDAVKDFTPVSLVGTSALFLTLHQSVPANSFTELVAYIKANPGKVNYGSSGTGSIHHLATEAMKASLGLQIVHVPYKGMGQAVPALLGGQVNMLFSALPAIESHMKAGTVKIVAVSTLKRQAQQPQVPTIDESGVPNYVFVPEIGVLAPAGTPPPVIQKLSAEFAKAVRHPETVQRFAQLGIEAVGSTPEAYGMVIRAAYQRYGEVVRVSGAKVD